ncbi:MAG: head GIN domain-containing protein [Spirochaetales bacterium]|jgi:hypothetical protein
MKRVSLIIFPLILITSSCVLAFPFDGIVGNGKVITAALPVAGFSAVRNMTSAKVLVNRGASASAKATVDENILEALDIHVDNGVLIISTRPGKSIYHATEFAVHVTLASLSELGVYGSGDILVSDRFSGHAIQLSILGSGDISGSFDYDELAASIMGSGEIRLAGISDYFKGTIAGSGDIHGDSLTAARAIATINGSGSCTLRVNEALDARIYGSGSVYYYGSPMVSQIDAGSGSLRQLAF